jgi:putative hydrolase of HD superfamily
MKAGEFISLMRNLALAPYQIERATTVPFDQNRRENDAEHSFSLGIAALCLAPLMNDNLDIAKVSAYALVHDLAEIYAGDTPVYAANERQATKEAREKRARSQIAENFGLRHPSLIRFIEDYAAMTDKESRFVYALDKIVPHAIIIIAGRHPSRPTWSAYKATEHTAREKIGTVYPALLPLFEDLCRRFAEMPGLFSEESKDNLLPGRLITIAA